MRGGDLFGVPTKWEPVTPEEVTGCFESTLGMVARERKEGIRAAYDAAIAGTTPAPFGPVLEKLWTILISPISPQRQFDLLLALSESLKPMRDLANDHYQVSAMLVGIALARFMVHTGQGEYMLRAAGVSPGGCA